MKESNIFSALNAIEERYLDEALASGSGAGKKRRARILRIVLPAAALVALLTVTLVLMLPGGRTGDLPDQRPAEISPDPALSEMDLVAPPTFGEDGGGLLCENRGDRVQITDYLGESDMMIIPEEYNGARITNVEICEKALEKVSAVFYNGESMPVISLPESKKVIMKIGRDARSVDGALSCGESISYYDVDAGNPVFASYDGMLFSKDLETLIICPAGYRKTRIAVHENGVPLDADTGCLPKTLKDVRSYAFSGCAALRSIELPPEVKTVGSGAFKDCVSLEELSLPGSLSYIAFDALDGCSELKILRFDGDGELFDSLNIGVKSETLVILKDGKE